MSALVVDLSIKLSNSMKNGLRIVILTAALMLPILGCHQNSDKDIVILCTSDVHCEIQSSENNINPIGYASLSAYKKELEKHNYVTLMDCGDAISGGFVGAVSKGEYIVDIMNEVGYDAMVLGNHEFDFGMDILKERVNAFKGDVLSCNFKYIGQKENKFTKVKPYKVINYGKRKVGFVGVSTPYSITDSTPSHFQEDGVFAYSFSNQTPNEFYTSIQNSVDACYQENANYVFLLAHLGEQEEFKPYSSIDVAQNTKGITAIFDGHSHQIIEDTAIDKDGKNVPIFEPGYQMNRITKLTIKKDQSIDIELVDKIENKDLKIVDLINTVNDKVDKEASEVLAHSDLALSIYDEDGVRKVRSRETQIGNFVTDSYRIIGEAQIGITNGGGIRADLKSGDITFKDIMALHPFGNHIDVVSAKGQQILDYLEFASSKIEKEYYQIDETGKKTSLGEDGSFAQVSGLKYAIDTDIPSSVVLDEKGMYIGIEGPRRVKDVMVLDNDNYAPLNANENYTLCSHNYLLEEGGGGASMFEGATFIKKDLMLDYEILVLYMTDYLDGHLADKYQEVEGRITVI